MVVAPEAWYRIFWVIYLIVALVACRWFLINPVIDAINKLHL